MKCPNCPVTGECFADRYGVTRWCDDLDRFGQTVLYRSTTMGPRESPAQVDQRQVFDRASHCPSASQAWESCACIDRTCNRHGKVVGMLDCLLCVAEGTAP